MKVRSPVFYYKRKGTALRVSSYRALGVYYVAKLCAGC